MYYHETNSFGIKYALEISRKQQKIEPKKKTVFLLFWSECQLFTDLCDFLLGILLKNAVFYMLHSTINGNKHR